MNSLDEKWLLVNSRMHETTMTNKTRITKILKETNRTPQEYLQWKVEVYVETYLNDFSSLAQVKIQVKSQFQTFLKKKIKFLGFPCCSTHEDLSIDASITNVGLILTKPGRFLFSGYGQTDGQGFGILTWKHVGTQKISTQSSKLVVSRRFLYASPEVGDA